MASEPTAAPGGSDRGSLFYNLARGAKLLALLCFFLPWVTVSCAGQELASMSGYELAAGSVTVTNPVSGARETPPGAGERDLPVIVAACLILVGLGATFALARGLGALVGAACAAGAAVLIGFTVLVRLPGKLREGTGGDVGGPGLDQQQIAEMIRIENAPGFWLTLAALIAAIVLNLLVRSRSTP